jgi:DNA-binding response OmpR family regulator
LEYEGLTVDLGEHVVERDGRRLDLSPLEYDLLVTMLRRPRRVFTREELLDQVWDGADVGTGAVERYISYLRGKVDDGFDRPLIQTVRGAGYTLRA